MKKIIKLLSAGVLMSILCAAFAACNTPKEQGQKEEGTEIQPVPVSEMSGEVAAFFEGNVALIVGAIFFEQNDWENRKFVDACVMINSAEEFGRIDFRGETPPELPTIDFNSYTLVIGQWVTVNPRYSLASRTLVIKQNEATMKLIVGASGPYFYSYMPMPEYFWGLYPKIYAKAINMTVERNYPIND
jgi:hypothetical protein